MQEQSKRDGRGDGVVRGAEKEIVELLMPSHADEQREGGIADDLQHQVSHVGRVAYCCVQSAASGLLAAVEGLRMRRRLGATRRPYQQSHRWPGKQARGNVGERS